jgi:hypothetical protein
VRTTKVPSFSESVALISRSLRRRFSIGDAFSEESSPVPHAANYSLRINRTSSWSGVCRQEVIGAVLASLADTLMPEAFEHGRPLNSMATAAGFLLSFILSV